MASEILKEVSSGDEEVYYCPEGPNQENTELIHQAYLMFTILDATLCLCGFIRTVYFIYVLRACNNAL